MLFLLHGIYFYKLEDREIAVRFSAGVAVSFAPERPDLLWGSQDVVFLMGNGSFFFGGKAAGAWRWRLTFIYCCGLEWVELYHHSAIRRNAPADISFLFPIIMLCSEDGPAVSTVSNPAVTQRRATYGSSSDIGNFSCSKGIPVAY